ncbi:flavin reductase family protein [Chachezhania sediminis]|uniref:flavin reductase family protein n=1 Tax=Chachezhania sediminis TaxID=2599291 RepID=UPI00131AB4CB|nr:flavin reductase family protein [Chachezhania sediminis]
MFYRPEDGHGLPHNPFNAIVTPRPIAWISTQDRNGVANLAPYSFFTAMSYVPPQIAFGNTSAKGDQDHTKDTVANIRETGVFCVNIVEYAMRDAMNRSSETLPKDVDEFEIAGVTKAACSVIDCPRVEGVPASLECRMTHIIDTLGDANQVVLAEVVGVHLRDDCLRDGIFDILTFQPLSRLGYRDYTKVSETFSITRPDEARADQEKQKK